MNHVAGFLLINLVNAFKYLCPDSKISKSDSSTLAVNPSKRTGPCGTSSTMSCATLSSLTIFTPSQNASNDLLIFISLHMIDVTFQSSAIQSASYDERSGTLTVNFVRGGQDVIPNVSKSTFEQFQAARSAGGFYNQYLRK